MSSGLTHTGAIARGLGYAPSPRAQAPGRSQSEVGREPKAIQPRETAVETRERLREQVMAERGVDLFDLYLMDAQQRIVAEAAIMAETALREREAQAAQAQAAQAPKAQLRQAPVRATGNFVDLRI